MAYKLEDIIQSSDGTFTYLVHVVYDAPHKNQGTPARLHRSRKGRAKKLFKGWRP